MSHSEVESGGRQRLSILADAFESVVGAVYLDQGFEAARAFIERWLLRDTRAIVADKRHTNYKSHLQEYVQSTFRTHPVYRIRSEMGPDHSKQFMVEVIVGKRTLGEGRGATRRRPSRRRPATRWSASEAAAQRAPSAPKKRSGQRGSSAAKPRSGRRGPSARRGASAYRFHARSRGGRGRRRLRGRRPRGVGDAARSRLRRA